MRNKYLALPLLLASLTTACVPTLAGDGDGSIAYVAGELQAQEALSIDDSWSATIRALEALELNVKEQDKDALSAKAVAYGSDDKKVTVRLRRESADTTGLKVRVGLWGDKGFSMTILEKIEEEAGIGMVQSKSARSRPETKPFNTPSLPNEAQLPQDPLPQDPLPQDSLPQDSLPKDSLPKDSLPGPEDGPAPAPRESLY